MLIECAGEWPSRGGGDGGCIVEGRNGSGTGFCGVKLGYARHQLYTHADAAIILYTCVYNPFIYTYI